MNAIQEKRHVSDSFIIAEKVTFEEFFLVVKSCLRVWMPFHEEDKSQSPIQHIRFRIFVS